MGSRLLNLIFPFTLDDARERRRRLSVSFRRRLGLFEGDRAAATGFSVKSIHHRGTELAEFGVFLNQKLFTPRPRRLRGAISESLRCVRR